MLKKRKYGHPAFYKALEDIANLHEEKNRQYATPEDPLGNFRRTGQITCKMLKPGIDPTLASCLSFMSKQVDGVYELFGEMKENTIDSLEDKLQDITVYSVIALILVREIQSAKVPAQKPKRKRRTRAELKAAELAKLEAISENDE